MPTIHEVDTVEAAAGRLVGELLSEARTLVVCRDEDGYTAEAVVNGRRARGTAATLHGALAKAAGHEVRLRCRRCRTAGPADEFVANAEYAGGRKPVCRVCERSRWAADNQRRRELSKRPVA